MAVPQAVDMQKSRGEMEAFNPMLSRLRQAEDLSPNSSPRCMPTPSSPSSDERWADIAVDPATGYEVFEEDDGVLQQEEGLYEKQGANKITGFGENSVGSRYHDAGRCKPCAFFHTKGCNSGASCLFCHRCPAHEKQRRKRLRRQLCHSLISSFESRNHKGDGRPSHPSKAGHSRHPSDTASTCSGWGDSDGQFHHSRQGSTSTQTTSVYESGEAGNMANLGYGMPPPSQMANMAPAPPMPPPMAPAMAAPNCMQAGPPPEAPMLTVYPNSPSHMMSPHGNMSPVMMTVPPSTQMEVMPMDEFERPIMPGDGMPMLEAQPLDAIDTRRAGDMMSQPPPMHASHLATGTRPATLHQEVHSMTHSMHGPAGMQPSLPEVHHRACPPPLTMVDGQSPYGSPVSPTGQPVSPVSPVSPVGYVTCGSYQYALVPVSANPYPNSPSYGTVASPPGVHDGYPMQAVHGHEQRWMHQPGYHHGMAPVHPAHASAVQCGPAADQWW